MAQPYPVTQSTEPLSIGQLSDEDLASLIQQHEQERADLSGLSDEELASMLQVFQAPGGEIETVKPIQPTKPVPQLSSREIIEGPIREFAGGAGFELADEAEAYDLSQKTGIPYERIKQYISQQRARYGEAHPTVSTIANLAGSILPMMIPGVGAIGKGVQGVTGISRLASPFARTVASGGVAGGLSGFGAGEGTAESLANIPTGIIMGGGFGAAAYGGGKAFQFLKDAFTSRGLNEEDAARRAAIIVNRRMAEEGTSPEKVGELWKLEQTYGIPSVLGTTTPELARLTENVVQTPSGEQADLMRRLVTQQTGAKGRVRTLAQEAVPTPDYFASADVIQNSLRRNADTAYRQAYKAGDITDPDILSFLKAPDVQGAYQDAIANSARLKEAARLRGEDPSEFDLRELFTVDPQGNVRIQNIPDIRTLDFIKQAMDRRISSLYSSGQGGEATALRAMRDAFVDKLDDVGPPEYKAARQQYKGDIEIRDALELGKDSGRLRWQEFNRLVKDYTPGELQAFKTGFMQNVIRGFEDAKTNRNFAKELLQENQMRKFRALMNPDEFKVFEASLKRERDMFDQIGKITQGSATYGRQAQRADIESQIAGGDVEGALNLILNPTPGNIFMRAIRVGSKLRDANVSKNVYTQLARILKAGDPQEVDDVLSRLEAAAPEQKAIDQAFERRATRASVAAAKAVAPSPVVPEPEAAEFKPVLELPPLEGPSGAPIAEPSAPSAAPGGPSAQEGGVSITAALDKLLPNWNTIFGDGSLVSDTGVIKGEDVAKALGIPLSSWLSYVGGQ